MITVAIANHKGGSTKTTTAVNLAAALGELGRRVLVVDLDPQGSATTWLGSSLGERSILDAYLSRRDLAEMAMETSAPGVDVVPSSPWFVAVDRKEEIAISLGIMSRLESLSPFWDYVLVDCPPSQGSLAVSALGACRHVLIPVETRILTLTGLINILGTIEAVQERLNPDLSIDGILACRVNGTRHAREIVQLLRERYGSLVFETIVRETIGLAEAPSFQVPITLYRPNGTGARDYRAVAREMLERGRLESGSEGSSTVEIRGTTEVLARG